MSEDKINNDYQSNIENNKEIQKKLDAKTKPSGFVEFLSKLKSIKNTEKVNGK